MFKFKKIHIHKEIAKHLASNNTIFCGINRNSMSCPKLEDIYIEGKKLDYTTDKYTAKVFFRQIFSLIIWKTSKKGNGRMVYA